MWHFIARRTATRFPQTGVTANESARPAYLVLVFRCANDRDGFRDQYGSQGITQHVSHVALVRFECGISWPGGRRRASRKRALPLTSPRVPPILFSFSAARMTATDFGFSTVRRVLRSRSVMWHSLDLLDVAFHGPADGDALPTNGRYR